MTQTTILAAASTLATSTDVVVTPGTFTTIGIFSAAEGRLPVDAMITVYQDSPGVDNIVQTLNNERRSIVLIGPGTYRVIRQAYTGTAFGAYSET